jgi:hypothetical protein
MTYAVYGDTQYKYGDANRLYGVSGSPNTNKLWTILIDWDGDGMFSQGNEARYCIGLEVDRGLTEGYLTADDGAVGWLAPATPGSCTLTFANGSERFSAWSTATGSLGTQVMPGKRVKIMVRDGYAGTDYGVFAGITKKYSEDTINKTVTIQCVDGIEFLQSAECFVPLDTVNDVFMGDAFSQIMYSIEGWKWGWGSQIYTFMGGDNNISYFYAEGRAWSNLSKLAVSAGGRLFVDVNGDVQIGEFTGDTYTADLFLKDVRLSNPWENLFTRLYDTEDITELESASTTLWSQGSTKIAVAASSSTDIFAGYTYNNQDCLGVAASVTFTANSAEDGSGTNVTSSVSVTLTGYNKRAKLSVVNSYAGTIYFQTLSITGAAYTTRSTQSTRAYTDVLGLGEKIMRREKWRMYKVGTKLPRPAGYNLLHISGDPAYTKVVNVKIQNRMHQFYHDIGAAIVLDFSKPDLADDTYYIDRITHRWLSETGQDTLTEWTLRQGGPR